MTSRTEGGGAEGVNHFVTNRDSWGEGVDTNVMSQYMLILESRITRHWNKVF